MLWQSSNQLTNRYWTHRLQINKHELKANIASSPLVHIFLQCKGTLFPWMIKPSIFCYGGKKTLCGCQPPFKLCYHVTWYRLCLTALVAYHCSLYTHRLEARRAMSFCFWLCVILSVCYLRLVLLQFLFILTVWLWQWWRKRRRSGWWWWGWWEGERRGWGGGGGGWGERLGWGLW